MLAMAAWFTLENVSGCTLYTFLKVCRVLPTHDCSKPFLYTWSFFLHRATRNGRQILSSLSASYGYSLALPPSNLPHLQYFLPESQWLPSVPLLQSRLFHFLSGSFLLPSYFFPIGFRHCGFALCLLFIEEIVNQFSYRCCVREWLLFLFSFYTCLKNIQDWWRNEWRN